MKRIVGALAVVAWLSAMALIWALLFGLASSWLGGAVLLFVSLVLAVMLTNYWRDMAAMDSDIYKKIMEAFAPVEEPDDDDSFYSPFWLRD